MLLCSAVMAHHETGFSFLKRVEFMGPYVFLIALLMFSQLVLVLSGTPNPSIRLKPSDLKIDGQGFYFYPTHKSNLKLCAKFKEFTKF